MSNMKHTTLITGASSGIGLELACLFAKDGYNLVLVARSEDRLIALKCELAEKYGARITILAENLAHQSACAKIAETLAQRGIAIDILVNNAGSGNFGAFSETDWQKEREMISLNITALTELTKLLLPQMMRRTHGKILNVASTAGFQPGPLMAVYYATKAYVLSFSEALAEELRGSGVSVTVLCPGPTATGFQTAASIENSKLIKGKRLPSARDVAQFGYGALMKGKTIAVHGLKNKMLVQSVRIAPRSLVPKIVRKMQEAKKRTGKDS